MLGMVADTCNPSYLGSCYQEDSGSRPVGANSSQDPTLKIFNTKKGFGVTQVVEHLSSKCEALSSNPITAKKKINKSKVFKEY
jgi:hypothetical protein